MYQKHCYTYPRRIISVQMCPFFTPKCLEQLIKKAWFSKPPASVFELNIITYSARYGCSKLFRPNGFKMNHSLYSWIKYVWCMNDFPSSWHTCMRAWKYFYWLHYKILMLRIYFMPSCSINLVLQAQYYYYKHWLM